MKRTTDRSREENSTASPGKKLYSSPKLSEFGPVRQLTADGSVFGQELSGMLPSEMAPMT